MFGNPVKTEPMLSPDGTMIAYLAPVKNVMNVWVRSIDEKDAHPITRDADQGIDKYTWAPDNKHLLYIQDNNGNENWRLYAANLETGKVRDLTPFEGVAAEFVHLDYSHPNEILVALNRDDPGVHDVYRLNLETGELTLDAKNPGGVMTWIADKDFTVRAAEAANDKAGTDILVRDSGNGEWRTLLTWGPNEVMSGHPVSFTADGTGLYLVDARDYNTGRLVKVDVATGAVEVIAGDPNYDVSAVLVNPKTCAIEAVQYVKDRVETAVLDEGVREDIEAIKRLHRGDMHFLGSDAYNNTWLIGFTVDNGPVPYYTFDRLTKQATELFVRRPELEKYTMATMEPISYTSRDGLTIHGYLTTPPGMSRNRLPMVLLVHGGPWARDKWGINNVTQWLANRGYAVLQVNYRGSSGYGKDFVNAGNREWGRKVHYDLIDGVNWAIKEGIANPGKIAIFGHSFGGYAALCGAAFSPDVFRCCVAISGLSDLGAWIKSQPPYWSTWREIMYARFGNPETEEMFLKSQSPLYKADQIRIPVLIAQGANSVRIPRSQSDRVVDVLKRNNVEHTYLLFEDEGHYISRPQNRMELYAEAEGFLAKHLGGRLEGEPAR